MNFESVEQKGRYDGLVERLSERPIELIPLAAIVSKEELLERFPSTQIVACDFYIGGIECDEHVASGFTDGVITNIDHHAPVNIMSRPISSATLALEYVREHGPVGEGVVVINHTDCDSVLSSALVRGILPQEQRFSDAAIAADHTGAENDIADLLQALDSKRDMQFSLRNLEALLTGGALDEEAHNLLNKRLEDRMRAKKLVDGGAFQEIDGVYFTSVTEKFDAAFLPALLPTARVIIVASAMPDAPEKFEIKLRLGQAAPEGLGLNTLGLPDFGGRWNAGSTKRSGGTSLTAEEYAKHVARLLDKASAK